MSQPNTHFLGLSDEDSFLHLVKKLPCLSLQISSAHPFYVHFIALGMFAYSFYNVIIDENSNIWGGTLQRTESVRGAEKMHLALRSTNR